MSQSFLLTCWPIKIAWKSYHLLLPSRKNLVLGETLEIRNPGQISWLSTTPPPPVLGRSFNPIQIMSVDYAHHFTIFPPTDFQAFLRPWILVTYLNFHNVFSSLLFSAKFLVMSGPTETSSRLKTWRNIRVIDLNGNVDDISSTHIEDYNNVIVGGEIAAIIDSKLLFCGGSSAG